MHKPAATTTSTAPPRPLVWPLLATSALAVFVVGLASTTLILTGISFQPERIPAAFWMWVAGGCVLTIASLAVRSVRWVFLLRRIDVRIPIADAVIGYLSGLSLLFVPFLLGEIAVRATVQRSRARVPVGSTCVVNIWERLLDVVALAIIALAASGRAGAARVVLIAIGALTFSRVVRQALLAVILKVITVAMRRVTGEEKMDAAQLAPLASHRAWAAALTASVAAWVLPSLALWGLAQSWEGSMRVTEALGAYAMSALTGGLLLAPGGVLVAGERLMTHLTTRAGLPLAEAAVTVLAVRMVTAGLAMALGLLFAGMHVLSARRSSATHFDDIADAYAAQIPEARRLDLLARKTLLMQRVLEARRIGNRGLDAGCGPGWYVARMRELGFDVHGIDDSAGQIETARRHLDDATAVRQGSVLEIPAADGTYDFVYCINVLHHLDSAARQQAAFRELLRVLRPGGLLFVHEINTTNPLFRFYMGYVFPVLNCIDEGIERWLPPKRLHTYSSTPVVELHYFTFLPEFLPDPLVRALRPLERLLERSRLRGWSAHYMAVLQKT